MKSYLLDTNICALYLRGQYDIDKKIDKVGLRNCYISVVTLFELKFGSELLLQKYGYDKRKEVDLFLENIKILPFDNAIDFAVAEKARLQLSGTPADDNFDLLIAATAVVNGMVMVTDNTRHFEQISNIKLENWVVR